MESKCFMGIEFQFRMKKKFSMWMVGKVAETM